LSPVTTNVPKSDTQYEDASGTFVVTGDKCNATSQ